MTDPADLRFFRALHRACAAAEGLDAACLAAIARAVETGDPLDLLAARRAFDALETAVKDRLLRQAHVAMATDLSAIWDMMPGASGDRRPN